MKFLFLIFGFFYFSEALADDTGAELKKVINRCSRCHAFEAGKKMATGPNLFGVMGRKIGTETNFRFSEAYSNLGKDGLSWNEKDLEEYLTNNYAFLQKKNNNKKAKGRMNYNLEKPEDRKIIIDYIKTLK